MTRTKRSLVGHRILSLIGEQGAGKTTVARLLCKRLGAQHIEASGVVAELHNFPPREDMYKTNAKTVDDPDWLGRAIAERIEAKRVVISGVREKEVHEALLKTGINLTVVALWAPENERFLRCKREGKCKAFKEFQQLGGNEMNIGLRELLGYNAKEAPPTFVTSSFIPHDDVVGLIYDQLTRGWKVTKGHVLS